MTTLIVPGPKCVPFEAFKSFLKKYTRATSLLAKTYNLGDSALYSRASRNRPSFERFKFITKVLWHSLYSATSAMVQDPAWVDGVAISAGELWEGLGLHYCPKREVIAKKYLTSVSYLQVKFNREWKS